MIVTHDTFRKRTAISIANLTCDQNFPKLIRMRNCDAVREHVRSLEKSLNMKTFRRRGKGAGLERASSSWNCNRIFDPHFQKNSENSLDETFDVDEEKGWTQNCIFE